HRATAVPCTLRPAQRINTFAEQRGERVIFSAVFDLLRLVWCLVTRLFRSRAVLPAGIPVFRQPLNVLRRKSPKRLVFSNTDRLIFDGLYGLMPSVRGALVILKPATVIAWHSEPIGAGNHELMAAGHVYRLRFASLFVR